MGFDVSSRPGFGDPISRESNPNPIPENLGPVCSEFEHDKVGILKLQEDLQIPKLYQKWIKQEGSNEPPKCVEDLNQKKNLEGNKLTYENLKGKLNIKAP